MTQAAPKKNITFFPESSPPRSHQWRQDVLPERRGRPPKTEAQRGVEREADQRRRSIRWANEDIHRERNTDPLFN